MATGTSACRIMKPCKDACAVPADLGPDWMAPLRRWPFSMTVRARRCLREGISTGPAKVSPRTSRNGAGRRRRVGSERVGGQWSVASGRCQWLRNWIAERREPTSEVELTES